MLGCNFFLSLSLTLCSSAVMSCCSLENTNRTFNHDFDNGSGAAGISLEFLIRGHPLNTDPFPVPSLNVIMILREFRGAFKDFSGSSLLCYLQEWRDKAEPLS